MVGGGVLECDWVYSISIRKFLPHDGLGFAASRNRNSEEERSHCGLQQREKKGFLRENFFRNRESRTIASAELADQKRPGQMRGEMGTLRSVHPAQPPENGWLRSFRPRRLAHLSCFLFRVSVPTSRKPQHHVDLPIEQISGNMMIVRETLDGEWE
jgi:hypothetical protein